MPAKKKKRKPYDERTDLERIQSQWVKLTGLHDRTDYSAAVVRAATATEIAVTLALRREFAERSQLEAAFINGLFRWANGLNGKVERLLVPLLRGDAKVATVKGLLPLAKRIHKKRDQIAHSGHLCTKKEAANLIGDCKAFVHGIVRLYEPDFTLKERASVDG
jgi:hypothetical protein